METSEEVSTRRALERELEIARQIQAGFLPSTLPQSPGWEIAAAFSPAREVAGDFYDAFTLTNNRRIGLVNADVCDKGVGAALFMALFRTLIRAFAQQHHTLSWADMLDGPASGRQGKRGLPSIGTTALANAISYTSEYIVQNHGHSGMFATVFFGVLDPSTGSLAYVNAGHPPALILNSEGIKAELKASGPALGILPDIQWDIRQAQLEPGDTLLTYTDGVIEARNDYGGFFGIQRLQSLAPRYAGSAAGLVDAIIRDVSAFSAEVEQSDDITLLTVRRD